MWYALMSGSLVNLVALLNQHSTSFSPLSFKLHANYHDISMLMNAMGTQGQCLSLLAQHQAFLLEKLANSSSSPHILWHLSAGKGTSTHHSCSIHPPGPQVPTSNTHVVIKLYSQSWTTAQIGTPRKRRMVTSLDGKDTLKTT